MPEFDAHPPFAASDPDLRPDPSFWGPDRPAARHRRRRPPGVSDRFVSAIPSRDARTAVAAVVAVLVVASVLVTYRASRPTGPGATSTAPPAATARARPAATARARSASTPPPVVVHVAGAVTHPGVVTLPSTDRVIDAIDTAGGALATANLDAVNLAARLRDGEQILVPSTATTTSSVPAPTPPATG